MAGSTKACLLCGRTGVKLTKEHVLPKWLHRAMGIQAYGGWQVGAGKGPVPHMVGLNAQLRAVCGRCNNGWLHDLDRAFRALMGPSMRGAPITLSRASQQAVAMWGVTRGLLAHKALLPMAGGTPIAPQDAYFRWLHDHHAPTDLTQVWLAGLDVGPGPSNRLIAVIGTHPVIEEPNRWLGIHYFLSVGHLLFVIYMPVDGLVTRRAFGGEVGEALLNIWPDQVKEVRWPPKRIMTREMLRKTWPTMDLPPSTEEPQEAVQAAHDPPPEG